MSERDVALREFTAAVKKLGVLKPADANKSGALNEAVSRLSLRMKDAEGNMVMEKSWFFGLCDVTNEERRLSIILDTLMDGRDGADKWSWVRKHIDKTVELVLAQRSKGWVPA